MATKSSIHIKPCNIASSEAHNRRTAEYMRNIGESRIYVVPELSTDNEQWINPDKFSALPNCELIFRYSPDGTWTDKLKQVKAGTKDFIIEKQKRTATYRRKPSDTTNCRTGKDTHRRKKCSYRCSHCHNSSVGSLFGSGKLKELEHNIEQLHQEIANQDKATDKLKNSDATNAGTARQTNTQSSRNT